MECYVLYFDFGVFIEFGNGVNECCVVFVWCCVVFVVGVCDSVVGVENCDLWRYMSVVGVLWISFFVYVNVSGGLVRFCDYGW